MRKASVPLASAKQKKCASPIKNGKQKQKPSVKRSTGSRLIFTPQWPEGKDQLTDNQRASAIHEEILYQHRRDACHFTYLCHMFGLHKHGSRLASSRITW